MKHLQKFYNKYDLPWVKMSWELYYSNSLNPARTREVSCWWRDCLKMLLAFKNVLVCDFIHGSYILLWQDRWVAAPLKET
jgi:hypothetical protein